MRCKCLCTSCSCVRIHARKNAEDLAHMRRETVFGQGLNEGCHCKSLSHKKKSVARGKCCVLSAVQVCSVSTLPSLTWRSPSRMIDNPCKNTTSASLATRATKWKMMTTSPATYCPRLYQVSLGKYQCGANLECEAAAVVAIAVFAAAGAADAQWDGPRHTTGHSCVRAIRNLEIASE